MAHAVKYRGLAEEGCVGSKFMSLRTGDDGENLGLESATPIVSYWKAFQQPQCGTHFPSFTNVVSSTSPGSSRLAIFGFFREVVAPVRVLFGGIVVVIGRLHMPTTMIDTE